MKKLIIFISLLLLVSPLSAQTRRKQKIDGTRISEFRVNTKSVFDSVATFSDSTSFTDVIQSSSTITGSNINVLGDSAFAGVNAGDSNTGSQSSGFGYDALLSNTGSGANGFGYQALRTNTGGASCGFGQGTLQFNTGEWSNGFGYYALRENTGIRSSGFGSYALQYNTVNHSNAFGFYALQYNIGSHSNAFGTNAFRFNAGTYSNAFGYFALQYNTGDFSNGFGYNVLLHNEGEKNTAIGDNAFNDFVDNTGGNKTFDNTDITITGSDTIVIASHGFGSVDARVNLKYTEGTSAITGLTDGGIYMWKIVHADTLCGGLGQDITNAGSGTGHTFTPQTSYDNSSALGYDAEPDASNQIMLGNSNVTQVKTTGSIYSSGAGDNTFIGDIIGKVGRVATVVVAASNSLESDQADYVCNGTNDQVEIQSAIDAATNGGRVSLMEGTYVNGATFTIPNDKRIHLQGYGFGTILTTSVDGISVITLEPAPGFNPDTHQDVRISDLSIIATNSSSTSKGIEASGRHQVTIDHVYFKGAKLDGIYTEALNNAIITNCFFYGCEYGIRYVKGVADFDDVTISDNDFSYCELSAIYFDGDAGWQNVMKCTILGNTIEECNNSNTAGVAGIDIDNAEYLTIIGNTVTENYYGPGIKIDHIKYSIIAHNIFADNSKDTTGGYAGIEMASAEANLIQGNYSGTLYYNEQSYGIEISSGTGNRLYHNIFNGNASGEILDNGIGTLIRTEVLFTGTDIDYDDYYSIGMKNFSNLSLGRMKYWVDGIDDCVIVSDDSTLDFGTAGDLSIEIVITPTNVTRTTDYLVNKETGGIGWGLYLNQDDLYIRIDDNSTDASAIIGTAVFSNNTRAHVFVVFDRSGNATAYVDGDSVGVVDISGVTSTISNAGDLHIGNDSAGGNEFLGEIERVRIYNDIYTSTEVGVFELDSPLLQEHIGASQTELITLQPNRDFSGTPDWANNDLSAYDETGDLTITANGTGQYCILAASKFVMDPGKRYKLTFTVANIVESWYLIDVNGTAVYGSVVGNGTQTLEFISSNGAGGVRISAATATSSADFDDFTCTSLGNVAQYEPESITTSVWAEISGNDMDGAVTGATVISSPNQTLYVGDFTNHYLAVNSSGHSTSGDIKQRIVSSNVSNPPTDAELDTLFTSPATKGDGWTVYIDDSDSDNFYQVVASGSLWMIFTATKAL